MHKMVKCAISKAQKRGKLSAYTSFNRINNTSSSGDPLEGEVAYPCINHVV